MLQQPPSRYRARRLSPETSSRTDAARQLCSPAPSLACSSPQFRHGTGERVALALLFPRHSTVSNNQGELGGGIIVFFSTTMIQDCDVLTHCARQLKGNPPALRQKRRSWPSDPDLMGVREPEPLARLPQTEQEAWRRLWAEVARTMGRDQAAP
jgi:hypothetical protein